MANAIDPIQALMDIGIDEDKANNILASMSGSDYLELVSELSQNPSKASLILNKYGIKREENRMTEGYLGARFESLRSGHDLDESFGVMKRIDESFRYSIEVSEQTRDVVLDWLDENQISYQANNPLLYTLECNDRETAYRTGVALSKLMRNKPVLDSVIETKELDEMGNKSVDKRMKDAEKKLADMKPRNPIASLPVAGRAGVMDKGNPRKMDKHGRGTKHKGRFDEEIEIHEGHEFAIGDQVTVGEDHGTVKIPHGPNGTIGVLLNGHLEMVSETEVSRLDEGVMGMKNISPLFRLRELAGIKGSDDVEGISISEPVIDPNGILAPGEVGNPDDVPPVDMGSDQEVSPEIDMSGDIDTDMDDSTMDPMDQGLPGDIGSDPVEQVMPPVQSEAMAQIEDALNSIQTGLADIRLSEYKSLIQKLQDLTNQVQMMGRDYLGERRKK